MIRWSNLSAVLLAVVWFPAMSACGCSCVLHLDHCALAALLVPTPTPTILTAIKTILEKHNPLEEGPGAVYEKCEELLRP
jgi:hypothetical protein